MKKYIVTMLVVAVMFMLICNCACAEETYKFFDISEQNGANAKMFMLLNGEDYNKGADYTYPKDYYLGLDYLGYLYFDSDNYSRPTGTSADTLYTPYNVVTGALIYTIDGTDNNNDTNNTVNFTTKKEKLYWNINDVDYLINPNEKAIKLYTNVKTDNITDTELAARFNSLNQVTFNIEDGNYTEIGFLAACDSTRTLSVTLVYDDQDGSKTETKKMSGNDSNAKGQSKGAVYFQDMSTHAHASRKRTFAPYTVPVDSSRVLKEVKLKSNDRRNEIIIISAWGKPVSSETLIEELLDSTDENYNAEEEISKIDKIEAKLIEEGRTVEDLNEESLEKLNKAKAQIISYIAENLSETATLDNLKSILLDIDNIEKAAADYGIEIPYDVETKIADLEGQIAKLYVTYSPYVDLSIASGANSKMFVRYEDNVIIQYTDMITQEYNYIKDYINIEEYGKVVVWGNKTEGAENYNAEATPWGHYPIPYSNEKTDGNWLKYIPLDTDSKWNITAGEETLKYYIDTQNGKAIKLKKVSAKEIINYSPEQKADLDSMLSASVDIDKKCYEEIKLLAGAVNNQDANIDVVITYTDGKEETVTVTVKKRASESASSEGYVNAGGSRCFRTITINPDAVKPVEKLTFTLKETNREVIILSMLGKVASPKTIIENLSQQITLDNYSSAVTSKTYLDNYIAEKGVDFSSAQDVKEKYDAFLVKLSEGLFIGEISYTGTQVVIPYANHTDEDVEFVVFATTTDAKNVTIESVPLKAAANKNTTDGEIVIDYVNDCENKAQMKVFAVRQLNNIKPMGNPLTVDVSQAD